MRIISCQLKVFHRDVEEEWVLLHIEIQGDTSQRLQFSERMFRYFYRILDRYRRPVSAVAIYTGLDGKKMPVRFEYAYRKTRLVYEYHTLSILDFSDEELRKSDNPFALVMLAAKTSLLEGKMPELELLERKVLIANELFNKGFGEHKIRAIFIFLENYVLFEDQKMNRTFRERVKSQDKTNIMGTIEYVKQEAKEEARTEKETSVVEKLLADTDFSDAKIADIVGVSVEFVNKVKGSLKVK